MLRLYQNHEWLLERYEIDGWSQSEIAQFCGVSQATIWKWLKKFSIPARDMSTSHLGKRNGAWLHSPVKDYEYMYRSYVVERKSLRDIANENKVGLRTVARWMKKHDINCRIGSDAIVKSRIKESNNNWKGGPTCCDCGRANSYGSVRCSFCRFSLLKGDSSVNPNYRGASSFTALLRAYLKKWSQRVFNRDAFICRECGDDSGGNLQAHHIVPFSCLRDQILLENSDLDPTNSEHVLKLLEISKLDSRINDCDNGITLCKDCHIAEHRRIKFHVDDVIYVYRATVVKVYDGDTISADIDLGFGITKRVTLRLYGINTKELNASNKSDRQLAEQSFVLMSELCRPGKEILVQTYKSGKYGRWLALILLDFVHVNGSLVSLSFADETYY